MPHALVSFAISMRCSQHAPIGSTRDSGRVDMLLIKALVIMSHVRSEYDSVSW